MKTKQFPLADILSITTGRLCCDMGKIYEILNFVTGDNLYTHVLGRASKFAAPFILEEHPALKLCGTDLCMNKLTEFIERSSPDIGVKAWLGWIKKVLGVEDSYEIQCHEDAWMSLNPISELIGMVGEEKVVVMPSEADPSKLPA